MGGTHAVEFYSATQTLDDAGSATVAYTLEFTGLVKFQVDAVSKDDQGEIRQSGRETAKISLPFTETITYDWRVKYRSTYYDVEKIRDPNGLRRDLELTVVSIEQ